MSMTPQKAADIYQAAEELLSKARSALGDVDQFYRDQGVDPDRMRSAIAACTTQDIVDEASAQFDQIWREVEREAQAKQAEAGMVSSGHIARAPKLRRPLV